MQHVYSYYGDMTASSRLRLLAYMFLHLGWLHSATSLAVSTELSHSCFFLSSVAQLGIGQEGIRHDLWRVLLAECHVARLTLAVSMSLTTAERRPLGMQPAVRLVAKWQAAGTD